MKERSKKKMKQKTVSIEKRRELKEKVGIKIKNLMDWKKNSWN